jgi:hypothetical protein
MRAMVAFSVCKRRSGADRNVTFPARRTKEAMVHFPERMPDGTWQAMKLFTKRIPHTADFQIDGHSTVPTTFRQSAFAALHPRHHRTVSARH